jgi:hypothetical protein
LPSQILPASNLSSRGCSRSRASAGRGPTSPTASAVPACGSCDRRPRTCARDRLPRGCAFSKLRPQQKSWSLPTNCGAEIGSKIEVPIRTSAHRSTRQRAPRGTRLRLRRRLKWRPCERRPSDEAKARAPACRPDVRPAPPPGSSCRSHRRCRARCRPGGCSCGFRELRFVHIDGVVRQGWAAQ